MFMKSMKEIQLPYVPRREVMPQLEVREKDGKLLINPDQLVSVYKDRQTIKFQSATSVPTNFLTSASQVDIKIENYRGVLHSLVLQINVSESGGSNSVTPAPVPLFIDRIEFLANGGAELIQTIYGDNLFYNFASVSNEQLTSLSTVNNFNTSFAGPTAIAASGTTRYYLPIIGAFCEQHQGVYLAGLNGYILFRVYSRPTGVESGSGTLNVASMQLLAEIEQLPEPDLKDLDMMYLNNMLERPILDCVQYQVTQTFNASTAYTLTLQPFVGNCAFIIGGFRSSFSNTSGGARTYSSIGATGQVGLLDSAGANQNGGSDLDYNYLRYVDWPAHWNSTMLTSLPLITMHFSEKPIDALVKGIKSEGLYYFDTRDQLRITLDSAWASGTFTFVLYAYMWRHCHIDHGRYIVYRK